MFIFFGYSTSVETSVQHKSKNIHCIKVVAAVQLLSLNLDLIRNN